MKTEVVQDPNENAIQRFTKLIMERPIFATPYNYRGIAYTNIGEIDRTIEDFNTAIRHQENYAEAYSNRGSDTVSKVIMIAPSQIVTQP